jgi:hypothetical protein
MAGSPAMTKKRIIFIGARKNPKMLDAFSVILSG